MSAADVSHFKKCGKTSPTDDYYGFAATAM